MLFRTDRNNNPTAFTTDIAKQGGLELGIDYVQGESFGGANHPYYTAKLLGDPLALTIKVIDKIGYYTGGGYPRWTYIQMPQFVWEMLAYAQKVKVIAFHYKNEGGTEMSHLFTQNIAVSASDAVPIKD